MPATTITINREQRDGLYELVRNHLGTVGDLWDALERDGDYAAAERMGIEFGEDFRLLEDIGWGEERGRESFELTMPPHDLMEVLRRLRGEAGLALARAEGSIEDAETNRRLQRGHDVCEAVIADLDPREASPPGRRSSRPDGQRP